VSEARFQSPVDRSVIEPGALPLCDALNSLPGVRTAWSCEGHPWDGREPYVAFSAPAQVAFRIHQLLNRGRAYGTLQFNWWLLAQFQDDGAMQYILRPNDTRLSGVRRNLLVQLGLAPAWKHRDVLRDLAHLAALIEASIRPT
jgi:hypothetical protein